MPSPLDFELPWLKFFAWDWLNSERIAGFTLEQEAVYLRLCLRQWVAKNGYLPINQTTLASYARLPNQQAWKTIGLPVLTTCFKRKNGHYSNMKVRELWEEAQKKHAATLKAAKLGADARWKK